ncbi:hypothetical protein BB560_001225 [Smittium megazygosporum]|uniref:Uncharacterized protein n=1 Tax=Smittium megazygosporum TaxID=133381 RepID=A0A2T9ZI74_9FUNG|nr:hypothetical protein BB560_001225 [Smittium megazygosporum]
MFYKKLITPILILFWILLNTSRASTTGNSNEIKRDVGKLFNFFIKGDELYPHMMELEKRINNCKQTFVDELSCVVENLNVLTKRKNQNEHSFAKTANETKIIMKKAKKINMDMHLCMVSNEGAFHFEGSNYENKMKKLYIDYNVSLLRFKYLENRLRILRNYINSSGFVLSKWNNIKMLLKIYEKMCLGYIEKKL